MVSSEGISSPFTHFHDIQVYQVPCHAAVWSCCSIYIIKLVSRATPHYFQRGFQCEHGTRSRGTQPMSAELFYGTISLLRQTEDGIEMLMGPAGLEGNLALALVSKLW